MSKGRTLWKMIKKYARDLVAPMPKKGDIHKFRVEDLIRANEDLIRINRGYEEQQRRRTAANRQKNTL
jgi:hypothetical protein